MKKTRIRLPDDRSALSLLAAEGVVPRFIKQGKKLVYDQDVETIWDENGRRPLAFRISKWTAERTVRTLLRIDRFEKKLDEERRQLWDKAAKKKWIALAVPASDWGRYPRCGPAANWMALEFDGETIATPDGDTSSAHYGPWYGPPIPDRFEGRAARKPSADRWTLGNQWLLNEYVSARLRRARKFFELLHDRLARPVGVPPALNTARRIETMSKDGTGFVVSWWQVQAVPHYHGLPVDKRRQWVRIVPLELVHATS